MYDVCSSVNSTSHYIERRNCDYTYMYTGLLDHPEFKELHGLEANETDPWGTAIDAILWSASGQNSEEALSWAMIDKTA